MWNNQYQFFSIPHVLVLDVKNYVQHQLRNLKSLQQVVLASNFWTVYKFYDKIMEKKKKLKLPRRYFDYQKKCFIKCHKF